MLLVLGKGIALLAAVLIFGACRLPAFAQNSTIESLSGPVTAAEISSMKQAVADLTPGDSNHHNNYAYGNSGHAMEACGEMFDITRDRMFLDKLIVFCDKVVAIRNRDRVMWTGNIDPVWPNNTNNIWGCEQGDVASHLAYCAQLIAKNPSLWNVPARGGDANQYGKTCRARAETYLSVADETLDLFYRHNFIRADDRMITPEPPVWPDAHSGGKAVPWNQQGMICGALVRSAGAHAMFNDGSPHVSRYRKTAAVSIAGFLAQCNNFKYTRNGHTVCKWSYSGGEFAPGAPIRYPEDIAHGGYDITALWRAAHWLPGSVKPEDARMVADTLMEVIRSGTNFSSHVDGSGGLKKGMKDSWAYLSEWRPDIFPALVQTGSMNYSDAARYLWIKNARANGWRGIADASEVQPWATTATPGAR
jgi:hypothetical protein